MAGIYRQRHPERTVLYRVLFHYFERFLEEYEHRFEKEYGYLRPIIQDVVNKYLDCGNPKNGFARIKCKDCGLDWKPDKSSPAPAFSGHRGNANTNLLVKVEKMINKDELSLFYPKVLKGLRKLWQERNVK